MKTLSRIAILGFCCVVILVLDVASLQLVPDANAILGVRRRTARRTAIVMGSANAAASESAQQQAAPPETAPPPAAAPAPAAPPPAAPPPAAAPAPGALPLGRVVTALPAGCAATAIGGVEYYKCGSDYYKAAFQGSQLVYVTVQP